MGTHNEWKGGQTLGKYCDEVGDTENAKPSWAWIAASVHGCFLWSKCANCRSYFQTTSGEEWLGFPAPQWVPWTQAALRTNMSCPEIGSQLFTYASNAIKGLYKVSCSS